MLSVPKIVENITGSNTNSSHVFFISGPPEMIKKFKDELVEAGIAADRIITDEWS
jgi:NAD(P)H-flavin reductase